ncbi:DUF1553 domain-containing protein [Paraglaciecola aquimarina]|uniref:DUF1553 domain-containing protein n=1 Tax=Paraglaciecola aquimarina TaxID=1235557 RepID=A0ABU3SRD9_9ALTE|nr:DUF1553 domain-containing protein [Paraglaciecola aquimarina]MDU0352573.1 DUF1553 domain-containing protein [Paraglaciecola aquimarina]
MYTFIKRAFMYPSFLTFDMETREISHERRLPTNTPLQALVTLNDPVYHEAAQALGQSMFANIMAKDQSSAIRYGFKKVVSREPDANELKRLEIALYEISKDIKDSDLAPNLRVGAKWTAMASVLLNLDIALTR